MLRYFVAAHSWILFLIALLFGSGYARTSPNYYSVFGVGFIHPTHDNALVLFTLAATVFFVKAWWKTRDDVMAIKGRRRHEFEP